MCDIYCFTKYTLARLHLHLTQKQLLMPLPSTLLMHICRSHVGCMGGGLSSVCGFIILVTLLPNSR